MVRVKPRERNKSSPRYWIFPSQKQETKEIKSQTRKRAKLGVKAGKREGQSQRVREPVQAGLCSPTPSPRAVRLA